jgi:zinc protease
MFQFEPNPNLARRSQIFQIWIRPVEPANAVFALRMALYQLDKLAKQGISQEDFERTRSFLSKYVNVLTRTKEAELGYAIDSLFYGKPPYNEYLKSALANLKREEANAAIRRHLNRPGQLTIVAVTSNAEALKKQLASGDPSPVTYNSPKPEAVTELDKTVQKFPLNLSADRVQIVPVDKVFQ